jgi:hypothetical protein
VLWVWLFVFVLWCVVFCGFLLLVVFGVCFGVGVVLFCVCVCVWVCLFYVGWLVWVGVFVVGCSCWCCVVCGVGCFEFVWFVWVF